MFDDVVFIYLIEIRIAILGRNTDLETFVFPIEVCVIFLGEAWRRMLYPCICIDLLLMRLFSDYVPSH